ncbi:CDP-diacylglycerol diphosphatase [Xanthomonas campestris pv. phormiicola]|nr:CDP-diacylglycerol diphosphatase [Xanthomonas campestris pv. phormiicola]UYC14627.1 CDP-diacylglycerol diphosphatase [Xanthomonas campestris pv. phormiicola]
MKFRSLLPLVLLLALAACLSVPSVRHAADPDALWRILNAHCLAADAPRAADCVAVWPQPQRRSVVLKDSHGDFQFLLLPIERIVGIEDPRALQADAPNYFAAAWDARIFVERALGRPLPRQYLSLALNSPHGRSQEQLHIHVDCLHPQVRRELDDMQAQVGAAWRPLPQPLLGHRYLARRLPGEALTANPLRLLAEELPAGEAMRDYSLVLVGDAGPAPGFVLLATRVDAASGNRASGEELQDHACGLVTGAQQVLPGVR